ncbi:MAG TPA: aldose 1-epimerase [Solirubrobacteraceae bacterium]|nr:aldose 1-epimerase [Solirubrobacteraceae bacterium]
MGSIEGFDSVTVVSADGGLAAAFVPGANMVCHSLTHRGLELLHTGRGVRAYAEQGKTMGIPLLHPWANRLAEPAYEAAGRQVRLPAPAGRFSTDPHGLPIHGALPGLLRWEVQDGGDGSPTLSARLRYSGDALLELFPFPHELRLDVRATEDRLELVTTLRPSGEDPVPVSFGYHPYLCVPDTPRSGWEVSLGGSQCLVTDERMIPTGEREPVAERRFILGDQDWDDGLAGLDSPPVFTAAAGGRSLAVRFDEGYAFAQVYAPSGQDLICFEPMTAPTNALIDGRDLHVVAPGEEYRAAFSIAVSHN